MSALDETRRYLAAQVAPLTDAAARGSGGVEAARALARAYDGLLRARFEDARRAVGAPPTVALLALGGYGRGLLAPGSDLDLTLLTRESDAGALQPLAEALLHPLWDAGVSVGHAVRGVDELASLARDDLRTATALLDGRSLAGDAGLAAEALARARREAVEADVEAFIERLRAEMAARHGRFGGSVYLLEPEVKHGRGGLRDLDIARWSLDARWSARELDQAVRQRVIAEADHARLREASRFYWRLRGAMHRRPGRRADRLTFDEQEECAARLGFIAPPPSAEARDAAVAAGASALMSQWYRHAREVATLVDQLLDLARAPRRHGTHDAHLEDLAPELSRVDEALCLSRRDSLQRDPLAALRLLEEALARGLSLAPSSRSAVLAASRDPAWCEALRACPGAGAAFLRLLSHSAPAGLRGGGQRAVSSAAQGAPSVLAEAHDLGLLLAMIPEFEAVTARVQHDVYHVYTVDVHSVAAVDRLHELARGELAEAHPLATRLLAGLDRRELLCLATLLHDIGKAHGRHHARVGAGMAGPIARRLGLGEADAEGVAWLVQEHLTLYHVATRRDLGDPETLARLGALARDAWRLDALYLLTVADLSTTSPTAMTSWKARMLDELHRRAGEALDAHPEADAMRAEVLAAQAIGDVRGEERARLRAFIDAMPRRYVTATQPASIRRHARRLGGVAAGARAVCVDPLPGDASGTLVEVLVAAPDRPGLLSVLAASLHAQRLDVLHAEIHTRGGRAVDVFTVRAPPGRPVEPAVLERSLRAQLDGLLDGATDPDALMAAAAPAGWTRPEPQVPQKVRVQGEASATRTVLEVFGRDRPGLLYAVTRALHDLGVEIHLAKVNTEGRRVADVFYVTERSGEKLSEARGDAVREAVLRALG